MLFPTADFALFFFAVFCASWAALGQANWRKLILLLASYFFYGYWDWRFIALLAASSIINYTAGHLMAGAADEKYRKAVLIVAIALNLAILGFFKYFGFFLDTLDDLLAAAGLERDAPLLQVVLPVGISFFTFQGISYVVDVYRGEVGEARSPLDLFLYISFFPQLVAGPIVRAAWFLPQLDSTPELTRRALCFGLTLILLGLFKKMVVANYLATELVDGVFLDPGGYSSLELLIAVYGYAVQIYCDFSGYSDIAIGAAALLGYRFHRNFDRPYRARSLREFWRRWHISLSQWLRDYLYKPLGGSRHGRCATYRNLMITMLLGGVWHGAAWTFVVWGAIHGTALAVERALREWRDEAVAHGAGRLSLVRGTLQVLVTFHIVCLAWIFFRAEDFASAFVYLRQLGHLSTQLVVVTPFLTGLIAMTLLSQFVPSNSVEKVAQGLERFPIAVLASGFAVLLLAINLLAPEGTAPFIYFQF